jgi:HPt (histidine-containing phosphotransfer) domain-containing protein
MAKIATMAETGTSDAVTAHSLAAHLPAPIDRAHLSRMTFGDRGLEQEVLQLFDRQAALLIDRMRHGDGPSVGALAHTLKGSAAGIGASAVAHAAADAEHAALHAPGELSPTIDRLAQAIHEARVLIAELLRAQ